jgi:hypothetical protein
MLRGMEQAWRILIVFFLRLNVLLSFRFEFYFRCEQYSRLEFSLKFILKQSADN